MDIDKFVRFKLRMFYIVCFGSLMDIDKSVHVTKLL